MHPLDCPDWEYSTHPRKDEVLQRETTIILIELRQGRLDTVELSSDTRAVHYKLFKDLIPHTFDYYAGHYRGEDFRCLKFYNVRIDGDPAVGSDSQDVVGRMEKLSDEIIKGIVHLDFKFEKIIKNQRKEFHLLEIVNFTCKVFELFLRIHPYVNGNGHAGRFIVWAIFGKYGYWLKNWPIDPRPPNPPYIDLIKEYRNGNKKPMKQFLLSLILN